MKVITPEISWHNRAAILSVHCQNIGDRFYKIATGGIEKDIKIWKVEKTADSVAVHFLSNLERHQNTVNIVRFSPNGTFLASGDSEGVVNVWRQSSSSAPDIFSGGLNDEGSGFKNVETWLVQYRLRDHQADCDVCDLCWSPDSKFLLSCSVDRSVIVWNVETGRRVTLVVENEKRFPVGVCWDPRSAYFISLSNDRVMTVYSAEKCQRLFTVTAAEMPSCSDPSKKVSCKLFCDSSLMSYVRRPGFSPLGDLYVAPAGCIEEEKNTKYCTYIFSRHCLKKPIVILPCPKEPSIVIAVCPVLFKLRETTTSMITLPYSCVFAVLTKTAVIIYSTDNQLPIAYVSNIHYVNLTDCAWSEDGNMLIVSSEDGYCTTILFENNELGEIYDAPPCQIQSASSPLDTIGSIIDAVASVTPKAKSTPKSKIKQKPRNANVSKTMLDYGSAQKSISAFASRIGDNNDCLILNSPVKEEHPIKPVVVSSESNVVTITADPAQNQPHLQSAEPSENQLLNKPKTSRRVNFVTLASTPAGEDIAVHAITKPSEIP